MKRLMFLLSLISICFYLSCNPDPNPDPDHSYRMEAADAAARAAHTLANAWSPLHLTPEGEGRLNSEANTVAVAASLRARELFLDLTINQVNPHHRVPRNLLLEFNPYEADGDMHNDALNMVVKEKLEGIDLLDKLKNKDRETIDKFLKLNPIFQDDNVREDAVDAIVATEVPAEFEDGITKIVYAKNYSEVISYLDIPADEKALVTEVFATCNDYYMNEVNFLTVADYINSKITFLLSKGKDMTEGDQRLACLFTIFKHSYYYWHGTK